MTILEIGKLYSLTRRACVEYSNKVDYKVNWPSAENKEAMVRLPCDAILTCLDEKENHYILLYDQTRILVYKVRGPDNLEEINYNNV